MAVAISIINSKLVVSELVLSVVERVEPLKTCARAGQFRGERVSRIKNRVSSFDLPLKGYEVFVRFAFSDDGEFIAINKDLGGAGTGVVVAAHRKAISTGGKDRN